MPDEPQGPGFEPLFPYSGFTDKYIWRTRGENCGMCDTLEGRVYIFDRWASAGVMPGFHLNCNCYLELVSSSMPESDLDFFGNDLILWTEILGNPWDSTYFRFLENRYPPYNQVFTDEVLKFTRPGETVMQAFARMRKENRSGFYFREYPYGPDFYQWRVFKTFRFFKSQRDRINSLDNKPAPALTRYRKPWETHRTYNPKNYQTGFVPNNPYQDRGWGR